MASYIDGTQRIVMTRRKHGVRQVVAVPGTSRLGSWCEIPASGGDSAEMLADATVDLLFELALLGFELARRGVLGEGEVEHPYPDVNEH